MRHKWRLSWTTKGFTTNSGAKFPPLKMYECVRCGIQAHRDKTGDEIKHGKNGQCIREGLGEKK